MNFIIHYKNNQKVSDTWDCVHAYKHNRKLNTQQAKRNTVSAKHFKAPYTLW